MLTPLTCGSPLLIRRHQLQTILFSGFLSFPQWPFSIPEFTVMSL